MTDRQAGEAGEAEEAGEAGQARPGLGIVVEIKSESGLQHLG